jgi:hypothetical protein
MKTCLVQFESNPAGCTCGHYEILATCGHTYTNPLRKCGLTYNPKTGNVIVCARSGGRVEHTTIKTFRVKTDGCKTCAVVRSLSGRDGVDGGDDLLRGLTKEDLLEVGKCS